LLLAKPPIGIRQLTIANRELTRYREVVLTHAKLSESLPGNRGRCQFIPASDIL
jgi:hypothetical protein